MSEKRKNDHLDLFLKAQMDKRFIDTRFNYEPLQESASASDTTPFSFLNYELASPLLISSMTGGSERGKDLNTILAKLASKYRLAFALGSIRPLLRDRAARFEDFNIRSQLGDDLPLMANLGIAQIAELLEKKQTDQIDNLIYDLKADALIIHINPIQEFIQPEGDLFEFSLIGTIREFIQKRDYPIIIKEVGQGFGPKSLALLAKERLYAIDLAAFGGTNFSQLELLRRHEYDKNFKALTSVGHDLEEMLKYCESTVMEATPRLIISGGVNTALDAYYYYKLSRDRALIGMASYFMEAALLGAEELDKRTDSLLKVFRFATKFLEVKFNA